MHGGGPGIRSIAAARRAPGRSRPSTALSETFSTTEDTVYGRRTLGELSSLADRVVVLVDDCLTKFVTVPITANLFFASSGRLWLLKISSEKAQEGAAQLVWEGPAGCMHLYGGQLGERVVVGVWEYSIIFFGDGVSGHATWPSSRLGYYMSEKNMAFEQEAAGT
ncbi:hypothetical protein FIBSPDRAFT_900396 [Athelia psychrophila]|uniref:Uncharacterized protein n=1 Tax=Athelia psychrophila TaxID=1759441 RepID=A0A165YGW3_9AGAM|nr:hypothetical protein FIBSPDRAFT_900396 [Fibularhizoctonia sp. CBS 109695]